MRPCWGQPPGFTPTRFLKMGETGNFSVCADWKADGTPVSIKKVPGPKWKTAILQRMCSAYWVLSQRPLCYPNSACESARISKINPPQKNVAGTAPSLSYSPKLIVSARTRRYTSRQRTGAETRRQTPIDKGSRIGKCCAQGPGTLLLSALPSPH